MGNALALGVVAVMIVAACGGSDDADGGATGVEVGAEASTADEDPDSGAPTAGGSASSDDGSGATSCDLLGADDVAAAGIEFDEGPVANDLAPTDECNFRSELSGFVLSVTIYTESEAVALGPDTYPDTTTLDGIGDQAWLAPGLGLAQARLDDGRVVSVQSLDATGDDALIELLRTAVGNIG